MTEDKKMYNYDSVLKNCLEYFDGDDMPAQIIVDKYLLKDNSHNLVEQSPTDLHKRLSKEFARIEQLKHKNSNTEPLLENDIFNCLDKFKYIVPQGRILSGLGNTNQYVTLSNCFIKGTRVYTLDGPKNIEDVQIGDKVITDDGSIQPVEQLHKNPLNGKRLYTIKCYHTPSITATSNHEFLSISKEQIEFGEKIQWNSLDYLRVGDYIAIPLEKSETGQFDTEINIKTLLPDKEFQCYEKTYFTEIVDDKINLVTICKNFNKKHKPINKKWVIDKNFAYFLGLWYGDGCIFSANSSGKSVRNRKTKKTECLRGITFTFGSHEKEIVKFVTEYGNKLFGLQADINDNTHIDNTIQIVWHSALIATIFEKLFGRKCDGKKMFSQAYRWDLELKQWLIQGLVDSDGCITSYRCGITIVLKNIQLIESFYFLIRSIGFPIGVTYSVLNGGKNDYGRLDFDINSIFAKNSNKYYSDNRIKERFKEETNTKPSVKKNGYIINYDGYTLVRIIDKEVGFSYKDEMVYNLGIQNIHSYNVNGLICKNCYVLSIPYDSYSGILYVDEQLVNICKRSGGIGIVLSSLRNNESPTKNAALTSTGVVPFMERYSNSTREVATRNRRGASIQLLHVNHPDILDFISAKSDKKKVTGSNISVIITDEFMRAVENDDDFELCFPVDYKERKIKPSFSKQIKARIIWKKLIICSRDNSDPGIVFIDNVKRQTPADCYEYYATKGVNPSLRGNTQILTNKGYYSIQDLVGIHRNGLKVITINNEWVDFDCFKSGENKQLWKIKHKKGEIYCTSEHSFPVIRNMISTPIVLSKTKDLHIDDLLFIKDWNQPPMAIEDIQCTDIYEDVYEITALDTTHTFCIDNEIISGNCGEIFMSELESCRLLLLNLFSYVDNPFTDKAKINYKKLIKYSTIAYRLLDDIVDLEIEVIDRLCKKIKADPEPEQIKRNEYDMWIKIKEKAVNGRRLGLGTTALADMLAALNIKYDTDQALKVIDRVYKTIKLAAYRGSVELAKEFGAFIGYDAKAEENNEFIKRIAKEDKILYRDMVKYGRRNVCLLTCSPAGTMSILTQTSSGIEPVFKLQYIRRRKINGGDKNAKVDFTDKNGDDWTEYEILHPKYKLWTEITGKNNIEDSPWYKCCAEDIDWQKRVEIQAALQRHICLSISSTVNLPNNITEKEVENIYIEAWKLGLKGITVYRQGSRDGVLLDNSESQSIISQQPQEVQPRPKKIPCDVHHVSVKGVSYFVLVGILNDRPYEIFAAKNNGLVKHSFKSGEIVKKRKGFYKVVFDDDNEIAPIMASATDVEETVTRLASTCLRANVDLNLLTVQLEKVGGENAEMHSFAKVLARVLKKYIKEGTAIDGEVCPDCGGKLIRKDGCWGCEQCLYTKCL
jgi:ribonucleotide reductase alpha subunit